MKIEHAAPYVKDLEKAREFFVKYFGGTANEIYRNEKNGFSSYFINFDGGARLEIMHKTSMDDQPKPMARTGFIHLAFSLGSKEKVDELAARLKTDGYQVTSGPRTTGDGYYEACALDAEGNQIEITL